MFEKLRDCWCALLMFLLFAPATAFAQNTGIANDRVALRTGWRLQSSCEVSASAEQISAPGFQTAGWHSTSVPSTVVAALVGDGTYPDPDFGMNLRKIPGTTYPIGTNFANLPMSKDSPFACSWWYRTEFSLPQDFQRRTVWLHFDGINYRANIWINGKKFADSRDVAGSYRIYDLDVTQFLRPGVVNAVAVETFAPTEKDLAMNWVDWNPAPPDKDMGVWGSVYLTSSGAVAVNYPEVITHFSDSSLNEADLTVIVQAHNSSNMPVTAIVRGSIENLQFEQAVQLKPQETRAVTFAPLQFPQLRVSHPKVWWPYGLGPQNLETVIIRAFVDGKPSDQQQVRFGIREITSEMPNNHLLFRINSRKILIRGGGWAPDMLMRESPRKLEAQFDYVREMGLNTIRLEGKLEPDDFFNLADERGVLVMAGWCCCSFWEQWEKWGPEDLQNATAQLRSQILRLRSHPSLLVWLNGSDNPPPAEIERAYLKAERQLRWPNPIISSATQRITSVSGPSGVKMTGPYDYVPPEYWLEAKDRGGAYGFNTETSAGPAPVVEGSLKKMMPSDQIWPPSECWHFHAGSGNFQHLSAFDYAMNQMYGSAKSLDDYERKAQAMTYENERAMFEAYARNKYTATGIIQWMLNNAWPSLIWHLYDYYLQPAGGYFGTKKANEMLHVQYSYDDRSVVVVNSLYHSVSALSALAQLYDFNLNPIFSRRAEVSVTADATDRVLVIPPFPQTSTPQVYFLKLDLRDHVGKTLSSNFYWLSTEAPAFEWHWSTYERTEAYSYANLNQLTTLPSVRLDATIERQSPSRSIAVHLHNPSGHLAFQVRMAINDATGDEILPVFWSDNYIELMPQESTTVTARYPAWINVGSAAKLEISGWNIEPVTASLSQARGRTSQVAKNVARAFH